MESVSGWSETEGAARSEVADGLDLFADGSPQGVAAAEEVGDPQAKVPPARDAKGKAQFAEDDPQAKVPPARDAKGKAQFAESQ